MIKKYTARIEGISPLLMHKWPLEPIEALEKRPREEQAEFCAYRDGAGMLAVPGANIQRALVAAAAFSKGKGRASLQKTAAAAIIIEESYCSLGVKEYSIDSRPVVIPATGGRILRHRPCLNKWKFEMTISFDATMLKPEEVYRIIHDCGSKVGLLDFRPERKGPFGRFIITEWQEIK
jgi:hypothetical protein